MGTKKTIAVLGFTEKIENPFLSKLAQHYRLLIVCDHAQNCTELSESMLVSIAESAVEVINCAKDGCWEADIIMLWEGFRQETKELQRLEAVATQKIVLILTEHEKSIQNPSSLFPHSKVINLLKNSDTKQATIIGDDNEAVQAIAELIRNTDYYQLTETVI